MDPKIEERICDDKRPGFRPTCEGYGGDAVRGYPKGCGRGAQRANTEGKPVVTLVAVGEIDLRIKWACADCIERSGLDIPTEVPQRCRCMNPGCSRPCRSNTNFWRFCGTECTDKLRKIVDERKAIHERQKRDKEAHQALASGVLALTARKFFCSAEHLKGYALTAKQTDGIVQKEVSDEWQTVSTHGGESQAAQLVRERYATWAKRARKWHAYLERERAWSTHGRLLSVLTGAASTLAAATVAPHYAPLVVGALMIATALIAWRGQVAQSRLESSRAADAWVSADRLAEVYKGLVVELDAVITTCDDFMKREQAEQVLAKSQQIEGAARFGVPEGLRSVLVEVCK